MIDHVEILAIAGRGGNGRVSFRREKYLPKGGPDGGDGGGGGLVVLHCSRDVRSLAMVGKRTYYRAGHGEDGGPNRKRGRDGANVVLKVPLGTVVRRAVKGTEAGPVGELVREGGEIVVACGGKGGRGNARLATAVNRAPRIAERGQRGEEWRVVLDVKMLSDVGIVGLPNVGKSSLLRALTNARPKVGPYAFTTVEPFVGVIEMEYEALVVAEMPGIVEGADEGAGLGLGFLRHVERTRLLLHVLDGSRSDPGADLRLVNREMERFDPALLSRPQIVVVNKLDLPEVRGRRGELRRSLSQQVGVVRFVSAATGEGVSKLAKAMPLAIREEREQEADVTQEVPVLRPSASVRCTVKRADRAFVVEGERAVALVEMMGIESDEARVEVLRRLKRMGVTAALRRAGVREGDRVRFGEVEMEWQG